MALKEPDARYAAFFELFNAEKFFEAHEVLEDLWRETGGPERDFYQGLIQVAAAFVHIQKGTPPGAGQLLKKAAQKLEKYSPSFLGLDISYFLKQAELALERQKDFPKILPSS